MAQQHINYGAAPNDGTGDTLRESQRKAEENFTELYGMGGGGGDVTLQEAATNGATVTDTPITIIDTEGNDFGRIDFQDPDDNIRSKIGAYDIKSIALGGDQTANLQDGQLKTETLSLERRIVVQGDQILAANDTSGAITYTKHDNITENNTQQLPNRPLDEIWTPVVRVNGVAADTEGELTISVGSGTVTEVTGTDGVTVANGTTTPVIGLGDITPDSVTASGNIKAATYGNATPITDTELGYVDGATSNIQTQINALKKSGMFPSASFNYAITANTLTKAFNVGTSGNGAFNAQVKTYFFDGFISLSGLSASSGSVSFGFLGTATVGGLRYTPLATKAATPSSALSGNITTSTLRWTRKEQPVVVDEVSMITSRGSVVVSIACTFGVVTYALG